MPSVDESKAVPLPDISRGADQRLERRVGTASETLPQGAAAAAAGRGAQADPERVIGRVVSVNGTHGVIDCRLDPAGEDWSVGDLITIAHRDARLIGVVDEVATIDARWLDGVANRARITFEFSGEIIDRAPATPIFHRGVSRYPAPGAAVHRIKSDDLRTIYTFRGRRGVEIGRLSQNHSIPAEINVDALITRHFALLGMTGVGKTTAASMLIRSAIAAKPNLRVLILDPHNEYRAFFQDVAHVIDPDNLELPFWMFNFDELMDVVFGGRPPHPDERDALYEAIQIAKINHLASAGSKTSGERHHKLSVEAAAITPDTPRPFLIRAVIATLDEWLGKLEQRYPPSILRTLRARLQGLSRDPRYKFMFSGRSGYEEDVSAVISRVLRIPTRGQPITIVELGGLPNEVVNSVVSVLARLAFEVAFWSAGNYEINVVCEEAQRYIPSAQGNEFGPARRAISRIAKEGRKYGASLGVISPRPSELDASVLSQCSTMFAMRLASNTDKNIIADAVGVSALGVVALLPSITDREAIAFGQALAMPMRMRFSDVTLQSEQRSPHASEAAPIDLDWLCRRLRDGDRGRE